MPPPKKIKMPLDYALLKLHEAMEMVFDYDRDRNFVPSPDQLVLLALMQKQIVGYQAMLLIIVKEMRKRAWEAMPAITPSAPEATTLPPAPPQAD